MQSEPPRKIGPYHVVTRLGSGGMGEVFLGASPSRRLVAVKVIRPELLDDPRWRERFRREVTSARSVSGFYTAPVVDADPDADQPWLATQYIRGVSLSKVVREKGPLREQAACRLGAGLAEALIAIHGAGIVHRDLKPSNVLLASDGPRVIDFGIARPLDALPLSRTEILGTPAYMSPEQALGDPVHQASDVFSLGSTLVFAATGAAPFGSDHKVRARIVHGEPDLTALPDPMRGLVTRCLVKDPGERPTPEQVLIALSTLLDAHYGEEWPPVDVEALIDVQERTLVEVTAELPTLREPPL
ncbi:serine/threonine-protein kinase [Actinomadura madurae]|uniref:serine/threonine-protein kinase n=2 Tax=Actinomadura madurae TaxID=1993 RepID=UPI0020263572|nr:serine/threonine-protein kinase [Actinomadura madurae]MCP9955841.1 serine/threonine protein kinase [Actinomadura madurae]MCP9985082.1 serine/threonine protein kinase [Actinomadura madurae]MCQ0003352.1 serine/threonine protein kinase [Actinomadura madurae]MCQ0021299.1 serine/threonine protein kinase [Actinomadura madurae]URN01307.1 serine/threonine protein kinase [Actinomadura madurae]